MNKQLLYRRIGIVSVGFFLGYSMSFMGFTEYDELHKMFVFSDLRMTFTFFAAVFFTVILFQLAFKKRFRLHRPLHKGSMLGGAIFGLGWALCGGCPSIPFVQIGQGKLMALASLSGMFMGMFLFAYIQRRFLHWNIGSCSS